MNMWMMIGVIFGVFGTSITGRDSFILLIIGVVLVVYGIFKEERKENK